MFKGTVCTPLSIIVPLLQFRPAAAVPVAVSTGGGREEAAAPKTSREEAAAPISP